VAIDDNWLNRLISKGQQEEVGLRLVEAREVLVDERGISMPVIWATRFPNGDQIVILEVPMPPDDQMVDRGYWVGIQRAGRGWPLDGPMFYASRQGATRRAQQLLSEAFNMPPGSVAGMFHYVETPDNLPTEPQPAGSLFVDGSSGDLWFSDGTENHRVAPNTPTSSFDSDGAILTSSTDKNSGEIQELRDRVDKLEKTLSTLVDLDVVALHKLLRYVERLGDPDA
jgi:hypothetical protein